MVMPVPPTSPGTPVAPTVAQHVSSQYSQSDGDGGPLLPASGSPGPVLESFLSSLHAPLWVPQLPHPQ